MKQTDEGVEVWGAKGRQPTPTYKISATYLDGYKVNFNFKHIIFLERTLFTSINIIFN